MISERSKPTRTELKRISETLDLSRTGHNLLEEKNEALILEYFSMSKDSDRKRETMQKKMTEAFDTLKDAQGQLGHIETRYLGASVQKSKEAEINEKKIMGVNLLKINTPDYSRNILERGYNITDSDATLDGAATLFEDTLPLILKVGEIDSNSRILKKEIAKTRRKVTALEDYIIPNLNRDKRMIISKLNERAREDFTRTKIVKRKIR